MEKINSCAELITYIEEVGFLPLLDMGLGSWSAEAVVDEECRYTVLPDGGWEWPLWEWKGTVIRESGCAYGKFFGGKAAFVSKAWWPHFCNVRRSLYPRPEEGTIEDAVLETLALGGSMTTRDLRKACGFTGPKMRSRFDSYVARLQTACRIVTADFVYPHDRHGERYGWGWSLLTTPEDFLGREACRPSCPPEESYGKIRQQLCALIPEATERQIERLLHK